LEAKTGIARFNSCKYSSHLGHLFFLPAGLQAVHLAPILYNDRAGRVTVNPDGGVVAFSCDSGWLVFADFTQSERQFRSYPNGRFGESERLIGAKRRRMVV